MGRAKYWSSGSQSPIPTPRTPPPYSLCLGSGEAIVELLAECKLVQVGRRTVPQQPHRQAIRWRRVHCLGTPRKCALQLGSRQKLVAPATLRERAVPCARWHPRMAQVAAFSEALREQGTAPASDGTRSEGTNVPELQRSCSGSEQTVRSEQPLLCPEKRPFPFCHFE